jgi:hypothetical protein
MKRIPFTIKDWKAGGVPVTRSGEYVKQLTYFEGIEEKNDYPMIGIFDMGLGSWKLSGSYGTDNKEHDIDLFLEIPCTKYYTHYYRDKMTKQFIGIVTNTNKHSSELEYYEYIKTVEVEL